MRTNIAYLFAGLLAVTLLSCSDDLEPLIIQEEETALMLDYQTVTDAQRALRPSTSAQPKDGQQPDKKGQKGRDHRDNVDYYGNERLKIESPRELQVGDLYVTGYDEEKDEYYMQFYWGDEISKETKEMLYVSEIHVTFFWKGVIYLCKGQNISSIKYYSIGDTYTFPGNICWRCTDIEVSISYYPPPTFIQPHGQCWTQSFESLMERYNRNK